jgi:hypothetical protein
MILLNTRRRVWRRTADLLAVAYRYAAHRRDLLTRERITRPPVTRGYAQGRADLQLTRRHGTDALLADMYRDPEHPLRRAVDADLRRRADRIADDARDRWNDLAARSRQRPL